MASRSIVQVMPTIPIFRSERVVPMTMDQWLEADGRVVTLDGIKHRLRVEQYEAIYPYKRTVTKVWATPVNRTSRYYRDIRAALGDDWSTDILESDVCVVSDVVAQLEG